MAVRQARALVATSTAAATEFMQALMGRRAMEVKSGRSSDAFAVYALRHHRSGQWFNGGIARSPISEGSLQRTAFVLQALNRYLPPAMSEEYEAVKRQSIAWMAHAPMRTTGDAAMKLVALHAAGGRRAGCQHADGGFSDNPEMAADAHATGEALAAFATTGQTAQQQGTVRSGAEWLRRTQQADGSWHVRSRSAKF